MTRKTQWPPPRLALIEKQLDQIANAVCQSSGRDVDDQIWLTRFLVVRTCGYLEQVVHETVVAHLEQVSYGRARSFAMSWLERSRNPSPSNMLRILNRLDPDLSDELSGLLNADNERLLEQMNLLVGRRNQIAHGENEGMGPQKALDLVADAKVVADWFIRRLDPHTPTSHALKTNP